MIIKKPNFDDIKYDKKIINLDEWEIKNFEIDYDFNNKKRFKVGIILIKNSYGYEWIRSNEITKKEKKEILDKVNKELMGKF